MTALLDAETADRLLGYISNARWFAGKGRRTELRGVTPLPWINDPGSWPAVRSEVVEVGYPEPQDSEGAGSAAVDRAPRAGSTELYQLSVSYWPAAQPELQHAEIGRMTDPDLGAVVVYDAMQDPRACRLVLDRLLGTNAFTLNGARVAFELVTADGLSKDLEPRSFTGQQSNTSVMYGEVAMLKLFRRLEIGHNLDIEVHESLSRAGVADVARLYGWVEASWLRATGGAVNGHAEPVNADLAMVVEKLAGAEDGWELALDTLRDGGDFTSRARDLGRALAEIHEALRTAFPTATVDGEQVAATMLARLDAAAEIAPALREHLSGLRGCFDALAEVALDTQRVHGDFHLGQTLWTPTGWKIIDFEGEPVKSLAERAEPDSVWRDLAGMLRSFDYGAASVPGPGSQEWAAGCRSAFLEGYADGALPPEEQAVLRAYEADKAIYEVVYETRNRPDWLSIPLAAVAALSSASTGRAGPSASASADRSSASASAEQTKE